MIIEEENLLSEDECNFLINFHKKTWSSLGKFHNKTKVLNLTDIRDNFNFIKELEIRITNHIQKINKDTKILFCEIVEWKPKTSMPLHLDFNFNNYSSIINLNNNYIGGETIFADKRIIPKVGKITTFEGSKILHGVNEIKEKSRFTIPIWYVLK